MSSSSEDIIPPSVKRERESLKLSANTKRRRIKLVKKIAQQEQYFFESWREKYEQNLQNAKDDERISRVSMNHAVWNHRSAFAALDAPRMVRARGALATAMQRASRTLKRQKEEKRKLDNFELVEKIHKGMVFQEQKEAEVTRLQKKLDRAKEKVLEAEAAKNLLIDGLDRLGNGELDSLIEEFEY